MTVTPFPKRPTGYQMPGYNGGHSGGPLKGYHAALGHVWPAPHRLGNLGGLYGGSRPS